MTTQKDRKLGVGNFVASMLESASQTKEVKPQTRFDNVDEKKVDEVMAKIKKGVFYK